MQIIDLHPSTNAYFLPFFFFNIFPVIVHSAHEPSQRKLDSKKSLESEEADIYHAILQKLLNRRIRTTRKHYRYVVCEQMKEF